MSQPTTGRALDAQLHLLDRQVVDPDGRMVCKVDDLELEVDDEGRPYVVAILSGPLALGPRLGGRPGSWMSAIARRLSPAPDPAPERIDFGVVTEIGSAVTIALKRDEVAVAPLERWVNRYIIERIPGNKHESE
jgi:sporulation protein YlmC with PRC-barrel domain